MTSRLVRPSSLRSRLALAAVILALPTLGSIVYTQSFVHGRLDAGVYEEAARQARDAAARIGDDLRRTRRFIVDLSQQVSDRGATACASLKSRQPWPRSYLGLAIVNANGTIRCQAGEAEWPPSPSENQSSTWFQRVKQNRTQAMGHPEPDDSGRPSVVVASAVLDATGALQQAVALRLGLDDLDWPAPPEGGRFLLVNQVGLVLASSPDTLSWKGRSVPAAALSSAPGDAPRVVEITSGDDTRRFLIAATVQFAPGLGVALDLDRSSALAGAHQQLDRHRTILLLVAVVLFTSALAGGEWLVARPVEALRQVTSRLAAGDLTARAHVRGVPGLSDIGDAVNEMAEALTSRRADRERAERELQASQDRYRVLFEDNPNAMWVFDPETSRILAVNQTAVERYGYRRDEFLTLSMTDLSADAPPGGDPALCRKHLTKQGATRDVAMQVSPIGWADGTMRLALATDVTERRELEDQLRHAQKMEAVGQLAGGIAHDFNNLLTAIQGFAELLATSLPADDERRQDVDEITHAAERAAALTRQLLAFGRRQVLQPRVITLGHVVTAMAPMLERLIGETIVLRTVTTDGRSIRADPGQMEQVVMNLVVNARDAMAESGGHLTITTKDIRVDERKVESDTLLEPGDYALLSVSDTGHGMDEQTRGRVFEPFFTTKPKDLGTGLGLSTVYGIVKQSGGHVLISSRVGRGTTVEIYLPNSVQPSDLAAASTGSVPDHPHSATILLVEDDDAVRNFVSTLLPRHGYTVYALSHPAQALDLVRRGTTAIDLLVTDVIMPGMSGSQLAAALRQHGLQSGVLYMSGYTDHIIARSGVLEPGVWFLQKPFTSRSLIRKIREALVGSEGGSLAAAAPEGGGHHA